MRILSVNFPLTEKDERKIDFFNDNYSKNITPSVEEEMTQLSIEAPNLEAMERSQATIGQQIKLLVGRSRLGISRNPMQSKAKAGP